EWLAKVADYSQALAIGIMGEADGGAASLHDRTELGHSLGLWLGRMWERGTGIIVNCKHFTSQLRQPLRTKKRTSAVTAINRHSEFLRSNNISGEILVQHFHVF